MRTKELFKFIKERHHIYEKRELGYAKPWTRDKILQSYRFCNVYRELDTQTKWLSENWRDDHKYFWFAALVFRFVNWAATADELGYPIPWYSGVFAKILKRRGENNNKVYSGAYMISTHGVKEPKYSYLDRSLSKIWEARDEITYKKGETLAAFHSRLMRCFDVGSFLAAQVIADAKFAGDMRKAPDWWTFAAPGPGSKRGLNRVFYRPIKQRWTDEAWRNALIELQVDIDPLVKKHNMPRISAQDLQNCLCEFDKYERVRLGEGRPKSKYKGV